jgi:uncharacterized delta-60 repeat protein
MSSAMGARRTREASRCVVERLENRQLLSANPALDTTFGTGGRVAGAFAGYATQDALGVAVQSDGKVVIVGDAAQAGKKKSAFIARFLANGKIDTTFGTKGVTIFTYGAGGDTILTTLKIQSNGAIVAAGVENTTSSNYSAFVARFTKVGKFDTTFAGTGKKLLNLGSLSEATGLVIQAGGKIDVIGGAVNLGTLSGGAAVAQLNTNGSFDTTFNSTGVMVTNPGTFQVEIGTCGVIGANGDLYVGGASLALGLSGFTGSKAEVLAIKSNGKLDTAFGASGRASLSFGQKFEFITKVGIDPITKNLYAGGTSANGAFAFGTPLPVSSTGNAAIVRPALVLPTPTLTAPAATKAGFALARLTTKGKLDTTFNTKGWIYVSFGTTTLAGAASMVILGNGEVLLAGGAEVNHGNSEVAMTAVNDKGKLDTTFGTGGMYTNALAGFSTGFFDVALVSSAITTSAAPITPAITNFLRGDIIGVGHRKVSGASGDYYDVELTYRVPF